MVVAARRRKQGGTKRAAVGRLAMRSVRIRGEKVRVWEKGRGRPLGVLPGHTERAVAVEFLADGDLATASWDKTARVWSLSALERPVSSLAAEVAAAWD